MIGNSNQALLPKIKKTQKVGIETVFGTLDFVVRKEMNKSIFRSVIVFPMIKYLFVKLYHSWIFAMFY